VASAVGALTKPETLHLSSAALGLIATPWPAR
jgi:hypothetical protein